MGWQMQSLRKRRKYYESLWVQNELPSHLHTQNHQKTHSPDFKQWVTNVTIKYSMPLMQKSDPLCVCITL